MYDLISADKQWEVAEELTFPEFFYYMDEMNGAVLCTAPFKVLARDIMRLEKRIEALENDPTA